MSIAEHPTPAYMGTGDNLDETVSRRLDLLRETIEKKSNLPPWVLPLVLYLVGQLIGGVWWGATMQAKVDNLTAQNLELRQKCDGKNDTQDLQIQTIQNGLDERIRNKAREVLTDWGYIHVPRKGD